MWCCMESVCKTKDMVIDFRKSAPNPILWCVAPLWQWAELPTKNMQLLKKSKFQPKGKRDAKSHLNAWTEFARDLHTWELGRIFHWTILAYSTSAYCGPCYLFVLFVCPVLFYGDRTCLLLKCWASIKPLLFGQWKKLRIYQKRQEFFCFFYNKNKHINSKIHSTTSQNTLGPKHVTIFISSQHGW